MTKSKRNPKMKFYHFILNFVIQACLWMGYYAHWQSFRAIPRDVGDGLSVGVVNCMLKDVNGFLWRGTPPV